jgi:hypothetical protein
MEIDDHAEAHHANFDDGIRRDPTATTVAA